MLHPVDIVEVKIAIDTDGIAECLRELKDALNDEEQVTSRNVWEKLQAFESAIEEAEIYVSDA